jgi:hypothetical protein
MFQNVQFWRGELDKKNVSLGVGIFQSFYMMNTFYKHLMDWGLDKEVRKKTLLPIANAHNLRLRSIAKHVELF